MKKINLIATIIPFLLVNCSSKDDESVTFGVLEWKSENLDVRTFQNGEPIPEAKTDEEWKKAAIEGTPAWCYYENNPANGKKYGKLYNWYAVNDQRGLCPEGWHIPTRSEWATLYGYMGGEDIAGGKLKDEGTIHWEHPNEGATNESGFSALPAGGRSQSGAFYGIGKYSDFWTSELVSSTHPHSWMQYLSYRNSEMESFRYFKGFGISVRCVRRISYSDNFEIFPADPPNDGILFVDHEANGRSGHGASTITECQNGDIIAFYGNTSGKIIHGHGTAGWSEYKRSEDGGNTWSEPKIFEYSKKVYDSGQGYALVWSIITAPDGTLIAIVTRFSNGSWRKTETPVYLLSSDNGYTWSEPRKIDKSATIKQISMTYNASFVDGDEVFVVFIGGASGSPDGPYSLYVSEDNGNTFEKRSDYLFKNKPYERNFCYSNAAVLNDGRFIVYTYNIDDNFNLPYVISEDRGYTWSEVRTTLMEKGMRNPQISEKIGDFYFMNGRGMGVDAGSLVLYASKDGINWDKGRFLYNVQIGGQSYSANAVVGKYGEASIPKNLLIQSGIAYRSDRVNIKHWWIENISGTNSTFLYSADQISGKSAVGSAREQSR